MNLRFSLLTASLITWSLVSSQAAARRYFITDLGSLSVESHATAINNHGTIVGYSDDGSGITPFIYRDGVISPLQDLVSSNPSGVAMLIPTAINDQGVIVGQGSLPTDPSAAFVLAGGSLSGFSTAISGTAAATQLTAVNAGGEIVGNSILPNDPTQARGFLADQGGHTTSFLPLNGTTHAYGINASGGIVGSIGNEGRGAGPSRAYLFVNSQLTLLGTMPGYEGYATATAVNSQGQAVGCIRNAAATGSRAFLYSNGRITNLGLPNRGPVKFISATAINDSGQIVGDLSPSANFSAGAFLYENGRMENLQSLISARSGWKLFHAAGINDSGLIVGYGTEGPSSAIRSFLLTPLPTVKIAGPRVIVTEADHIFIHGTSEGHATRIIWTLGRHRQFHLRNATGTGHWRATVALHFGTNYINVKALVPLGSSGTASITVIRK